MFDRPHHQLIARILGRLDAGVLRHHACWFGGGTAMALRYGEYRESRDVDFLVSDGDAFRRLRTLVRGQGLRALVADTAQPLAVVREPRIDADGIRAWVQQDDVEIKFEIVREARILFAPPGRRDQICGLPCLSPVDLAAGKLLANVDRGLDGSTFNRDVIDLAMMQAPASVLAAALSKASEAYPESELRRAIDQAMERFRHRPGWLTHCLRTMSMPQPEARMWQAFRRVERVAGATVGGTSVPMLFAEKPRD